MHSNDNYPRAAEEVSPEALNNARLLKLSALQLRYWKEAQEGSVPLSAGIASFQEAEGNDWVKDRRKVALAASLASQGQAVVAAAAVKYEDLRTRTMAASSIDQLASIGW